MSLFFKYLGSVLCVHYYIQNGVKKITSDIENSQLKAAACKIAIHNTYPILGKLNRQIDSLLNFDIEKIGMKGIKPDEIPKYYFNKRVFNFKGKSKSFMAFALTINNLRYFDKDTIPNNLNVFPNTDFKFKDSEIIDNLNLSFSNLAIYAKNMYLHKYNACPGVDDFFDTSKNPLTAEGAIKTYEKIVELFVALIESRHLEDNSEVLIKAFNNFSIIDGLCSLLDDEYLRFKLGNPYKFGLIDIYMKVAERCNPDEKNLSSLLKNEIKCFKSKNLKKTLFKIITACIHKLKDE